MQGCRGGRSGGAPCPTVRALGRIALALVAGAALAGCEISRDPATGEQSFRLVLPGTEENAVRREENWRRCLETQSAVQCQRQLGPRPDPADLPAADGTDD